VAEAGGAANAVTVNNSGLLTTTADDSIGLFAQSVGGGGGDGGFSPLGGPGRRAEEGRTFRFYRRQWRAPGATAPRWMIVNSEQIYTSGEHSQGIFAQSIGGGGGNGGFSVSTSGASGDEAKSVSVAVGGQGGTAGNAAKVSVTDTASITTLGHRLLGDSSRRASAGRRQWRVCHFRFLDGTQGKSLSVAVGGNGAGGGIGGDGGSARTRRPPS